MSRQPHDEEIQPQADDGDAGVHAPDSHEWLRLKAIAIHQKVLLYIVFGEIALLIMDRLLGLGRVYGLLDRDIEATAGLVVVTLFLVLTEVAAIFVVLLAMKLWGGAAAIGLGLGSICPCLGFCIILLVTQKAKGQLKDNGIRVGALGVANLQDIGVR